MAVTLPRRARLLEFALVTAIIGGVFWYFMGVVTELQQDAEKTHVEAMVSNLNSALVMAQAKLVVAGREQDLPQLAARNPMRMLQAAEGDIGGNDCPEAGTLPPGHWCWDPAARALWYRPRRANALKIGGELPWLTWRIETVSAPDPMRPRLLRVVAVPP